MASPFAFVPRNVAKTAKALPSASHAPPSFVQARSSSSTVDHTVHKPSEKSPYVPFAQDNGKGKSKAPTKSLPNEDYAILVCLALSDHALWSDPDLRRTIEQDTERCTFLSTFFSLIY